MRRGTPPFAVGLILGQPAAAQSLIEQTLGSAGVPLDDMVWLAITAGTALAAICAVALLMRTRRDDRLAAAQAETMALRSALDRTEALLDADDQRTVVWESAVAPPQVFGGLPERVGAPADKAAFLAFQIWLSAGKRWRSSSRPATSSAATARASRSPSAPCPARFWRRPGEPAAGAPSCASAS